MITVLYSLLFFTLAQVRSEQIKKLLNEKNKKASTLVMAVVGFGTALQNWNFVSISCLSISWIFSQELWQSKKYFLSTIMFLFGILCLLVIQSDGKFVSLTALFLIVLIRTLFYFEKPIESLTRDLIASYSEFDE